MKFTGWKALIVDDNLFFRQQMEDMLRHFGLQQIDHASNVSEAADKVVAAGYDIVFLDLRMPGKGGYNFLQACREDQRYDGMAFIVVSSESEERYISEAMKAGAIGYIVKPVLPLALQKNIDKVAGWKQRLLQLKS